MGRSEDWFGVKVRVLTPDGYRTGVVKGIRGGEPPNGFKVDYTDIERPKYVVVINNEEFPKGLSDWFERDDIEIIEEE